MVFSKESILKIKGFDERMFMYGEDLELSIRSEKLGLYIWYDADIIIYHKVQGSFEGGDKFKGLHPKNPHIAFQFYERNKNEWITSRTHLKGGKFFRFFFFYKIKYYMNFLRLMILSPKRIQILKAHFRITYYILFHRFRK